MLDGTGKQFMNQAQKNTVSYDFGAKIMDALKSDRNVEKLKKVNVFLWTHFI